MKKFIFTLLFLFIISPCYSAIVEGINCGFLTSAPTVDPEGDANLTVDYRDAAIKFTSPADATSVTEIGWYCNNATQASNFEVGIYSHNAANDKPDVLLGIYKINVKGTDAGWKKKTGLNIPISGNTAYWIAINCGNTATATLTDYTINASYKVDRISDTWSLDPSWGTSSDTNGFIIPFYAIYSTDTSFVTTDDYTKIQDNGAWVWFTNPRAIRYVGTYDKTYFSTVSNDGSIYISSYNNLTAEVVTFELHDVLQLDDHDNPSILVRPDGKLIAFYCKHGDTYLRYRISTNAEDVSAWENEVTISTSTAVSYENPIYLSTEGKIYVYFRGPTADKNKWSYITSTDNGENWSGIQNLIYIDTVAYHQYLIITSNGTDTIWFTHSGHPAHEDPSVYAFYYTGGNYYKSDGTLIGDVTALPLDRADMTLVYDETAGSNAPAWIWDIAVEGTSPIIAFSTFPLTEDHRYNYAKWNGSSWDVYEIANAGTGLYADEIYYSGGITLDKENPNIIYISTQESGNWELKKGVTADGGASWTFTTVTLNSPMKNLRPTAIINHNSTMPFIWEAGTYATYIDYDMDIYGYTESANIKSQFKGLFRLNNIFIQ